MKWIRNSTEVSLVVLGISIAGISICVSLASEQFAVSVPFVKRPVISIVVALIAASVLYLAACWLCLRLERRWQNAMLFWIVGVGILSRIALLGSTPILEIDLYRYVWDGNVATATGDPYKYAPIEFIQWQYPPEQQISYSRSDDEQAWLKDFSTNQEASMQEVIRIMAQHFGQYTSPYPLVSQIVFAASHSLCPQGSSLKTRVVVLKTILTLFDLLTGVVLILILRHLKLPETMSIVWFWSPLVLKEIANGGHLDSIAILLCMLFVLFAVKQLSDSNKSMGYATAAGVFLALGVGAKVFPVVLMPLWAIATLQRLGFKAVVPGLVSLVLVVSINLPMLMRINEYQNAESGSLPTPGVLAFAKRWEINDLIFMIVVENLKPTASLKTLSGNALASNELANGIPSTEPAVSGLRLTPSPWFVVAPESWRSSMTFESAFSAARWITMLIFLAIIVWLCWRWLKTSENQQPHFFVECVFLTLAWFWFLSPTQNPWYWCWVLPFVPFAKSRVWYLVAAVTLLYYLRFNFDYQGHDIAGFDFIVPFVEFGTILFLLSAETARKTALSLRNALPK